jgi:hypothetical protein
MALPPLSRLQAPPLPSALPPLALSLLAPEAAKLAAQFQALPPAPAGQSTPQLPATVVQSTPLPATEGGGVVLTFKLPNGETLQARSPTPLPLGSVVQLPPPPAVVPVAPSLTEQLLGTPTPPVVNGAPLPPVLSPTGPIAAQAPVILRALLQPATPAAVATPPLAPVITFAPAEPLPTLQLASPTPQPSPVVAYPARAAVPGPVLLSFQGPLPTAWAGQPLTLRLRTPTTGVLVAAPELQGPTTWIETLPNTPLQGSVAVHLSADLKLPLRNNIAVLLGQNIPNLQENSKNIPQTQIVTQVLPSPLNLSASLPAPAVSAAAPFVQALRLLVPPQTPSGEQLARVLPAGLPNLPPSPAGTQPVLLATGQVALLEILEVLPQQNLAPSSLPPGLPAGTVLAVNIPTLAGPAQILQLHSNQPQLLPQGLNQAAPSTPVQTPPAVLAAGSVVSGTITGQNAQGQPVLTLSSPAAQAGQSFALTLNTANSTQAPLAATLVVGSKVQIAVGEGGVAQLLSLELPSAAARATTLVALGGRWERLQQTLNSLQTTAPNLAAQARANLPLLTNFLPGLMRLLDAVNTKDPSKLLGESAKLASALGPDLTPDLAQLQQLLAKQPEDPTNWRGFIFPYLENPDGQPQQGSFMFRREAEDEARASTATRFVAELNLSQLGPVQLDGLITYPEIWLKLRVQQGPPAGFNEGLQAIITPLLAKLQLAGGISVETTPSFPLSPAADLRAAAEAPFGIGA